MARKRGRGRGRQGPSEADAVPLGPQQLTTPQTQRPRSVSSGQRSQHHNEVDISINARYVGTARPLLSAQSSHPCDDVADSPSSHNSVTPTLSTSMPEDQPGGMVDDAATLAPKIEATNKPRGRKREEDSDADALPTKRTKTDHASSNSDVHDRSKQKNGVLPGSPVRNDDQAVASTNGQTESNFNPGTGHANEATNKSSIPPRDLVQDIFDLILPEEVSGAAVGALQPHDGPSHNSFGASPEPEAETESQQLETSLSSDEQPKISHADQSTVVSSSHEAAAPSSTQVNNGTNNPALQALEYLEDPHTQDYLAENYGKRALQVGRGLTGKKYAKDAVNKYSPRNGWIHSDHESRDAGASESGLVIEFDMPVTRGDPSPPNPKSTRWLPAPGPEGAAVMYKKTIGIVTTNDEEYKNVKVFTTKSNKDLASFRKKGKLRHYAQIIRNPQENTVERERGVFCYLEIHCDDIDDIDLNIPGPRLMATMPLYQLPHVTPYRIVGYLKGSADIQLFCTIQKMAAAVAVEQSHESFDQRRPGWFERYRNTNATAGDNSTAAPQTRVLPAANGDETQLPTGHVSQDGQVSETGLHLRRNMTAETIEELAKLDTFE